MRKRAFVGSVALGVSLIAVAVAMAGGSIKQVSKSKSVNSGQSALLEPDCPSGTKAVAAGFDGTLQGDLGSGSLRASYPLVERLDGSSAQLGTLGAGNSPAKFTGRGYCWDGSVTEVKKKVDVTPNEYIKAKASCPGGRSVVSGGFKTPLGGDLGKLVVPVASYRSSERRWTVGFVSSPVGTGSEATAYAYCAKDTKLRARDARKTLQPNGSGSPKLSTVKADCKSGEQLVSGGYRPSGDPAAGNGPLTIDSYGSSGKWKVASAVLSAPADMTAFAYCRKAPK